MGAIYLLLLSKCFCPFFALLLLRLKFLDAAVVGDVAIAELIFMGEAEFM